MPRDVHGPYVTGLGARPPKGSAPTQFEILAASYQEAECEPSVALDIADAAGCSPWAPEGGAPAGDPCSASATDLRPQELPETGVAADYFVFHEAKVRIGFIRKVYGILFCQLCVTFGFIALCVHVPVVTAFVQAHSH